jgi:hypothetical protein
MGFFTKPIEVETTPRLTPGEIADLRRRQADERVAEADAADKQAGLELNAYERTHPPRNRPFLVASESGAMSLHVPVQTGHEKEDPELRRLQRRKAETSRFRQQALLEAAKSRGFVL